MVGTGPTIALAIAGGSISGIGYMRVYCEDMPAVISELACPKIGKFSLFC